MGSGRRYRRLRSPTLSRNPSRLGRAAAPGRAPAGVGHPAPALLAAAPAPGPEAPAPAPAAPGRVAAAPERAGPAAYPLRGQAPAAAAAPPAVEEARRLRR